MITDREMLEEAYTKIYEQRGLEGAGLEGFSPEGEQPSAAEMERTPERDQYTLPIAQLRKEYNETNTDVISDTFEEIKEAVLRGVRDGDEMIVRAIYDLTQAASAGIAMPPFDEESPGFSLREFGGMPLNRDIGNALEAGVVFDILLTDEQGKVVETVPSEEIEY